METGTKRLEEGNRDEAKSLFEKSYRLYSLFWEINSRAIYSRIEKEEATAPEKIEVKAPAKKEIEPEEKVVFVPVCKELL
jgi:hypothetical protein